MVRLGLPSRLKSYNGRNGDAAQSDSRVASPGRSPTESKGLVLKTKVVKVSPLQLPYVSRFCPEADENVS